MMDLDKGDVVYTLNWKKKAENYIGNESNLDCSGLKVLRDMD